MNIRTQQNDNCFVTTEELIAKVKNKDVYLFGIGQEASKLLKEFPIENVKGFLDNRRAGGIFKGNRIISPEEYEKKDSVIIITTARYMKEMSEQLHQLGFKEEEDFLVWDQQGLFHVCEEIEKYIDYNKKLYSGMKTLSSKKILIACDNKCDMTPTVYGMCANYLATKHNASIIGYMRFGNSVNNISTAMKKIYDSINVERIIPYKLDYEMLKETEKITDNLWKEIETFEDWLNITIYGISFGNSIIRTINRLRAPDIEPHSDTMKKLLLEQVGFIVFWYKFFENNDVKEVLLGDGVNWDSYIRDIAVSEGIKAYSLEAFRKMSFDYYMFQEYEYYDKFWNELSIIEQDVGVRWAKKHLNARVRGSEEDIPHWLNESIFKESYVSDEVITEETERIKILICPHIFEEEMYQMGHQLFDNNYISWLDHLGELSNKTDYDWYLKMHPDAQRLDEIIYEKLKGKYSRIKILDKNTSPHQLKKEGVKFALTIYGSIGHEYPVIGINVINAGNNPGMQFKFNINPKTKEEFDDVIFNLDNFDESQLVKDDLYKFYCIHYLYYNHEYYPFYDFFFNDRRLYMNRYELDNIGKDWGPWLYGLYMEKTTYEEDSKRIKTVSKIFEKMEEYDPSFFYRKNIDIKEIEQELEN